MRSAAAWNANCCATRRFATTGSVQLSLAASCCCCQSSGSFRAPFLSAIIRACVHILIHLNKLFVCVCMLLIFAGISSCLRVNVATTQICLLRRSDSVWAFFVAVRLPLPLLFDFINLIRIYEDASARWYPLTYDNSNTYTVSDHIIRTLQMFDKYYSIFC